MGDLRVELRASAVGEGPTLLLVHGTAVDQNTWSIQRAHLKKVRKLLYDRRGTGGAGGVSGATPVSIAQHAADAAELIRLFSPDKPVVVCGSSFGAVVALELLRTHPERVRQAVLLEPPMGPQDGMAMTDTGFMARFDALSQEGEGLAAGEFFLRRVLGDEAFERIPRAYAERSMRRWESIRRDCVALLEYPVRYADLRAIRTPVALFGGERSSEVYGKTLHALHAALGNSTLEFLPAGHMMHAEAHRHFNARLEALLEAKD